MNYSKIAAIVSLVVTVLPTYLHANLISGSPIIAKETGKYRIKYPCSRNNPAEKFSILSIAGWEEEEEKFKPDPTKPILFDTRADNIIDEVDIGFFNKGDCISFCVQTSESYAFFTGDAENNPDKVCHSLIDDTPIILQGIEWFLVLINDQFQPDGQQPSPSSFYALSFLISASPIDDPVPVPESSLFFLLGCGISGMMLLYFGRLFGLIIK